MKIFRYLAMIILIYYSSLDAQWVQSGLDGTYVRTISLSGPNLFVGTSGDGVFRSTNEGTSWSAINAGLTNLYVNAFTVSGTNLFAGTEGSGVFRSTNNGANWNATSALPDPYVYALAAVGTNLFAGTDGADGVYISSNNGASWVASGLGLTNTRIRALASSGSHLFTGTFGGGVFRSTNNGANWTPASAGLTNTYINAITISGTDLFASTEGGIFLSTNDGSTWTEVSAGLTDNYTHAIIRFSTNLFAGTEDGVFLSTNNGTNWTPVSTGLTNTVIWALGISDTYLFSGTNGNGLWRRLLNEIIPAELISFTASVKGNSIFLYWTTASEINNLGFSLEKSADNKNWSSISFIDGNGTTTSVQYYHYADRVHSSGKYFYRLKQIDLDGSSVFSDVVEVNVSLPTEFALEQNYPNPFNNSTEIKYSLLNDGLVTLEIYSITGEKVKTIVKEIKAAGEYNVRFDASELATETYFYKIRSGSFIETKKMVLLK